MNQINYLHAYLSVKIKHGLQLVITKLKLTHTCANADRQKDNVFIRRKDVLRSKANVQKVRRQLLFLNPSRIGLYICVCVSKML